jgi:hypothetical protein
MTGDYEAERASLLAEVDQIRAELRDSEARLRDLIKDESPEVREGVEFILSAGRLRLRALEAIGAAVRRAGTEAELITVRELLDELSREAEPPG